MNTKRTTAIVCVIGLAVFCLVAGHLGGNNASAQPGESTWLCNVAGTYVNMSPPFGEQKNAAVVMTTLVPLDPMGTRLKMVERWLNGDSTFGGMFPEADIEGPVIGEAVKVGHDTYKYSIIGYGGKRVHGDRGELQYIWATIGSLRIIDCDTIEVFDVYIFVHGAEQDKDSDGFADNDEKPIMCIGPLPGEARKRVTLMEPCEPDPEPAP